MARKLLLADDDIYTKEVVEKSLARQNFEVLSVEKAGDVYRTAKKFHPDIIVINGSLQEKSGYDICSEIKKDSELEEIPVLLLIDERDEYNEEEGLNTGVDAFLKKPLDSRGLAKKVFDLIDMSIEKTVKLDMADLDILDSISMEVPLESKTKGEVEEEEEIIDLEEMVSDEEGVLEMMEPIGEEEVLDLDEPEVSEAQDVLLEKEFSLDEESVEFELEEEALETGERAKGDRVKTEEIEEISFEEELEEIEGKELDFTKTEKIEEIELNEEIEALDFGKAEEEELKMEGVKFEEFEDLTPEGLGEGKFEETEEISLDEISLEEDTVNIGLEEKAEEEEKDEGIVLLESTDEFSVEGELDLKEELDEIDLKKDEMVEETREGISIDLEEEEKIEELSVAREELTEELLEEELFKAPEERIEEETEKIPKKEVQFEGERLSRGIEEIELSKELQARAYMVPEPIETEIPIREIFLEEIPLSSIGLSSGSAPLELTHQDFDLSEAISEPFFRDELIQQIHDIVESLTVSLAPSIVEKVAREIALKRTEEIIREEIERIKGMEALRT